MTTLHLVRSSAFQNTTVNNCLSVLASQDTVILLDDGIYNLQHPILAQIQRIIPDNNLLVIGNHALARGIEVENQLQVIELSDVIELSLSSSQSITWQ